MKCKENGSSRFTFHVLQVQYCSMSTRRMLPFILLNIFVSAAVVLGILYWWDGRQVEVATETVAGTAVSESLVLPTAPAQLTPLSTDTPPPTEGPPIHTVVAGDTLGNLADFYGVTVDDMMIANNLTDPNVLSVGQQLIIPVGGIATATPPPADTPIPNTIPTPIATEPVESTGSVNIQITEVIGIGQYQTEAVQLINSGADQVAMLGWTLSDQNGHEYVFGQVTLFGSGAGLLIYTASGRDRASDLYWGQETAVWEPGEVVSLTDPEGNIQATFVIP